MARRFIPILSVLTLIFILSCASGGGGLANPEESLLSVSEIEVKKASWRKDAPVEIRAGDELIGYLKRLSESGTDVDGAEVFSLDDKLLFTLKPSVEGEEWLVSISGSDSREGSIRTQRVPSGSTVADLVFPGGAYAMSSAYQFKGGADGYGHHQWIITESDTPLAIFETKAWNDRATDEIFMAGALLNRRDEALALVALGVLYAEMDALDRYKEDEREAADYLKRKTRSDSSSNWLL